MSIVPMYVHILGVIDETYDWCMMFQLLVWALNYRNGRFEALIWNLVFLCFGGAYHELLLKISDDHFFSCIIDEVGMGYKKSMCCVVYPVGLKGANLAETASIGPICATRTHNLHRGMPIVSASREKAATWTMGGDNAGLEHSRGWYGSFPR